MIAPSGIFDYRNDDPTNLRQYSNILVLDFDDFGSHEAKENSRKDSFNMPILSIFTQYGSLQATRV